MFKTCLSILMLICSVVIAQDVPQDLCVKTSDNRIEYILSRFPFNKAKQILIVSYKDAEENIVNAIPTIDGEVDITRLHEAKRLNKKSRSKLVDLLMNIKYDPATADTVETGDPLNPISIEREISVNMCYTPKHAILFQNDIGRIYSYVEISFECLRYKTQPDTLNVGDFCFEKFQMLENFFRQKGIVYGIGKDGS